MADTLKVLAQTAPSATTLTDVYTVPASTSATISSVVICNRSSATTFRMTVAPAGAVSANQHYLYMDQEIAANTTFIATIGITMAATDVLRVYAGTANLSVNVFGVEVI